MGNPHGPLFKRGTWWVQRFQHSNKLDGKWGDGLRGLKKLSNDRGAVATIFVLLAGSGFFVVLLAMTADAGTLYLERRATENAADATSLAVASFCALGSPECASSASLQAKAREFANLNSNDGRSKVEALCGFAPLLNCSGDSVSKCKVVPSNIQRYGRVTLSTENSDGTTSVNSPFLSTLLGNENLSLKSISCSQSAWGKANSARIPLPLAITICDYQAEGFKILRDYRSQLTSCPTIIKDIQGFNISPQPTNLINGWAIFAPTNEQLLCLSSRNITVGMSIDTLPPGAERCNDAGISGSESKGVLAQFISANLGKKVFIPVIASTSGTGTGSAQRVSARVVGFFTFIFYGYDLGSQIKDGCGRYSCSEFNGVSAAQCGSQSACIWGKFTRGIVPGASVSRDTSFPPVGAQAVELLP